MKKRPVTTRLTRATLTAMALLAALQACSQPSEETPATQHAPAAALDPADTVAGRLQTFAWDCEQSGYIVQNFRDGPASMWLFLSSETLQLERIESASGARYGNSAVEFWSKGRDARLSRNDQDENCRENRRASIIEDAKLRGMDFWASGNEPAWTLEIGAKQVLLVSDYGSQREQFLRTGLEETPEQRATMITAKSDDKTLQIALLGEGCTDSMSGEQFATAVTISFKETVWQGCGTALH